MNPILMLVADTVPLREDIGHVVLTVSLLETKKIGDMAEDFGIPMAMHQAGSPIVAMANVHCAAATQNFIGLEMHSVDVPWWDSLVDGVSKPIIENGFVNVPEGPGLGIELNEEAIKSGLDDPEKGYFAPTPEWDDERAWDRLWSRTPPGEVRAPRA